MGKKHKIGIRILLLVVAAAGITAFVSIQKKTEIVWYLTDPVYYGVDQETVEPYQEIRSKRFELFNKRLKELGIQAKVVFQYAPYDQHVQAEEQADQASRYSGQITASGKKVKTLVEHDPEADITEFSPMEYKQFLSLNPYFETEGMKQAKKAIPEELWEVNSIRGKTYQIPRGNASVNETVYCFYKPFLEEQQVVLEEEKIRRMSPEEVVAWLLPYFAQDRHLDGTYYLTSGQDLAYSNYFLDQAVPLLEGTRETIFLKLDQKLVTDIFSLDQMRRGLELYQFLYQSNLDAHEGPDNAAAVPVFTISNIPSIRELCREGYEGSVWKEVPLGNARLTGSHGNGVLTGSRHQELAVQVLAAASYDEELSNLMIYGVLEEDYRLEDGHAMYTSPKSVSPMGSFSAVGNNLIAYPNEAEAADKEEKTRKLLQETSLLPYSNFVPDWEEGLLEKMSRIAALYQDAVRTLQYSEVPDLEQYVKERQEALQEEGLGEILSKLQKQVDEWEE